MQDKLTIGNGKNGYNTMITFSHCQVAFQFVRRTASVSTNISALASLFINLENQTWAKSSSKNTTSDHKKGQSLSNLLFWWYMMSFHIYNPNPSTLNLHILQYWTTNDISKPV